jgi:hypothetical protein
MLGLALAACSPGEVGGGDDGADDDPLPEEALCNADATVSGTFAPEGTPPGAELGCVPQGVWTVNVTFPSAGDCGDVPPEIDSYVYTVTGEGRDQVIDYTAATGEDVTIGIHAGGNGECEGTFEHIWPVGDGTFHVLLLKPYFEPGTQVMLGSASYQLWSSHP